MSGRLVVALPSKGRLQENTLAFLARAGLHVAQDGGARDYRGKLKGVEGVDVLLLSASDIVGRLAAGEAHLGVTGEDLVREAMPEMDRRIALLAPLGFGGADVVVAVPKGWIDASTMEDLEEIAADFHARHGRRMRVATKYVNLTRRFFAAHGVADYRIVESLGATEGAPAAGAAELIVDITTTGATLEANALKVLADGVILRSQANLAASTTADWTDRARQAARLLLSRISAEHAARTRRLVRAYGLSENARARWRDELAAAGAEATSDPDGWIVAAERAPEIADAALRAGAENAAVSALDYLFSARCPLDERLSAALDGASR